MMILVAILVTQIANAQVVREEWVIPIESTWVYCLDEDVNGQLVYDVMYKFDKKENLVRFSMHNKGGFLTGVTTGNTYKYVDNFHEKYGAPPQEGELMVNGILKIISLGDGKVYDGRVQVHIDVDKCGELEMKKYIWEICFSW